jgi:hypothetical protein
MYGETASHEGYVVTFLRNSDVGIVKHTETDRLHTVRDMALKIQAHGSLTEWLASFVKRGGLDYVAYKRSV